MRLPAHLKLQSVTEVVSGKKTVSSVAKEIGVSRKTLHSWINLYKKAPFNKRTENLFKEKYRKGKYHPSSYRFRIKSRIIREISKNPNISISRLSQKIKVGRHAIYNQLCELGINTEKERKNFSRLYNGPARFSPDIKTSLVRTILEEKQSISDICRQYHVSRKTIYQWIKRYKENGNIEEKYATGQKHPRAFSTTLENAILSRVVEVPEYSIHSLAKELNLSSHGVFNVLKRYGLTYKDARVAFASSKKIAVKIPFSSRFTDWIRLVWEEFIPSLAPAPPPSGPEALRAGGRFLSYFKTFSISAITSFLLIFGILSWIRLLGGTTTPGNAIGLILATTALGMGSIFFLYSLKYYLTLAVVLSFSQSETTYNKEQRTKGGKRGLLSWILGLGSQNGPSTSSGLKGAMGLTPNLEHVTLKRYPYISIHIPFYNEKNVVERAIAASTNFDYPSTGSGQAPGYEVILCDDSTDETTQIIEDYLRQHSANNIVHRGEGWELTEAEVRPGVTIKHLHRTSREGFKGGALREALKHTDTKVEFVCVFDADFVPYPDTLTLFLKYFQVVDVNSLQTTVDCQKKNAVVRSPLAISPIAAVQGYQWHVLNKSENWITRGVRAEYAGSYVIERSGTEIYSGLKQISGAVYMIRRDVLDEVGWETSITEDFQLTLKLYEKGYKVIYTPYIQAPAECVSTINRLIRQRMRWAEGHSNNIRRMLLRLLFGHWEPAAVVNDQLPMTNYQSNSNLKINQLQNSLKTENSRIENLIKKKWIPSPLTFSEKLEFLYLSPYYLQAFFFLIGTISWLISETVFRTRLPFWTSLWGWSLVLTNLLSLPLMNAVGLFLEESEERDYQGIASFIALSYLLVPFQAYASLKGFLESKEGPWFRTPKTGRITDIFTRGRFYRFIAGILPGRSQIITAHSQIPSGYLSLATANSQFNSFNIRQRKNKRWLGKLAVSIVLIISTTIVSFSPFIGVNNGDDLFIGPEFDTLVFPEDKSSFKPSLIKEVYAQEKSQNLIPSAEVKQDFNWGVLAINTNKSIYLPDEIVKLGMAVLDEKGKMNCDAKLELRIMNNESKINEILSTENGKIKVNPECYQYAVTSKPDYESDYQAQEPGIYSLELTAETKNGAYSIKDSFEVKEVVSFEIERKMPTRIYPKEKYGVSLILKANYDFSGEVVETVPSSFDIDEDLRFTIQDSRNGLGEKNIVWKVDWKKGQTSTLEYFFDAPDISPEFYSLGPLKLKVREDSVLSDIIFGEVRSWQIASDATVNISGSVLGTNESSFIGNPPCDGSTQVVSLRVNGGTASNTYCNSSTGAYSFSSVTVNSGDTITLYLNSNSTPKANTIMVIGTSSVTGVDLYRDRIIVRDEPDGTITIADMVDYDNDQDATNMLFDADTSPSTILDTDAGSELHIWTGDTFAPGGNCTISGSYHNTGTATWSTYTTTFDSTSTGNILWGTLTSTSAFYKVTFNGSGGAWTIQDAMKVSKANGTDTLEVQQGTVTLGDGTGDNLEVNGKMIVGSTSSAATFQTLSTLAQGSTINIDINNNTTPVSCTNCIIQVGTSTNSDPTGTFTLNKNATVRFNSYSSVQSGFEVLASGYLDISGSLEDSGTDGGTDNATLRETKICADKSWTADLHNNKHVMMTSGLALSRIYAITDTLVSDNDCANNSHDSILRADTSSATDTNPTVTGGSCSGTGSCTITTSTSLISGDNEGIGKYLHNTIDDQYYLIVDSTNSGSNDIIVITTGEPDTFTNMATGDDIEITDGVRSGDTFYILDLAYVTAQAGTSCNDSENGYIYVSADSQTRTQYAELCDLGAAVDNRYGMFQIIGAVNNNDSNEGFTLQYSYLHDSGFRDIAAGVGPPVLTQAVIQGNLMSGAADKSIDIGGGNYNVLIKNNRIMNTTSHSIILGLTYRSTIQGNRLHNSSANGLHIWDWSADNIIKDNMMFANSGEGIYIDLSTSGDGGIYSGNKTFSNNSRGILHSGGNKHYFVDNQIYANSEGHEVTDSTGNIEIMDQYGVKAANSTNDFDYADSSGYSQISCYGCTLGSSTEIPANDVSASSAYFASFKHDATNGVNKVWGEYSIPADVAETPQTESTQQLNYTNTSYPDSITPHLYDGNGQEDTNIGLGFSGGSLGGSSNYYVYRVTCKNSTCSNVSPSNDWDVYRDEVDIGDATTGSQYIDSTTNVQFTIEDAGTDYSKLDSYLFIAWKGASDTNSQKSLTMMQTGDSLTVGSGKTIEVKGNATYRTLIQKDSGATSYTLSVTGTIDANYYKITGTDASGLNLGTGATVTDLDNGTFDDSGGAGASDTYITVVASILNTGAQVWTDMVFDEGSSDSNVNYNITLSGTPTSCDYSWTFNSSGNKGGSTNGEANDNETDANCSGVGYILWINQGITSVWSFQRKTFFDSTDDRYWRFYYDGSEIDIFYNQSPWSDAWTPITSLAENIQDYSVVDDNTYVYIAYYDTYDIRVRRGTLNTNSITWGSEYTGLNGTNVSNTYQYAYIHQDSSGYLWLIARYYNGTNYYMRAVRSSSANDVSSWGTVHDLSSTSNTDSSIYGLIVPLASQDMYAIWIRGSAIEGRQWDNDAGGDQWDPDKTSNPDSIATGGSGMSANITATTDTSANVHLAYVDSSNYVQYLKCAAVCSGSFSGSARLDGSAGNQYVTSSVNTTNDNVYIIWIKSGNIYYNYYTSSWQGEAEVPNWTEGTSPSDLTSNYADAGRIFAVWTSGSASPYTSHWDYIIIPERLFWLFFAGPILPLIMRRKKEKIIIN